MAFPGGGAALATGSWDMTVKLWDLDTGHELMTLRGHAESVRALAVSPDGRVLASASWDGTVRLWDPSAGRELAVLRGNTGKLNAVAFNPAGPPGERSDRLQHRHRRQ